ncbi:hypothetical protein KCH_17520 [Kitasatospora cheerisanensis KCTC 2395]|uniref:Uncharacterized protein n=1 Tax=Kitasatospora cheerisanensis KCTC 2395 TaxID=1348663 RepID=A0A066Z8I3_9ACTN|nr:hypothetical protein KCH_17520 [Kitasatospora cheerisanensis KCTC 2395]
MPVRGGRPAADGPSETVRGRGLGHWGGPAVPRRREAA